MSASVGTLGIDRPNVDEPLALVEEILTTICADSKFFPLTDEPRVEVDRHVDDADFFPEDGAP